MSSVKIRVNQLGYLVDSRKTAVVVCDEKEKEQFETFSVFDENNNQVYSSSIPPFSYNIYSDEYTSIIEFSDLKDEGQYYIKVEDDKSFQFKINNEVYNEILDSTVKMFYLQRCGCELPKEFAGDFAHKKCHDKEAIINGTDKTLDVTGGWHDAGDYGRYVTATAKTLADLMLSYELFQENFSDNTNIPESKNGIPDVIDEIRFALDWMFKMQDTESGGVYHKVTCASFCAFIMPEDEKAKLFICPISTVATADFAAVMAMAYRIFQSLDLDFSKKCLAASERAYEYLENHPNLEGSNNPPNITTGSYQDSCDTDERFWAACALYRATGKEVYNQKIKTILKYFMPHGWGWGNIGYYGFIEYFYLDNTKKDKSIYEKLFFHFISRADELIENSLKDGYGISIKDFYPWGSNMVVSDYGKTLIFAYILTKKIEYLNFAYYHLFYILGCNPVNICYVTGFGSLYPEHPHHRPSGFLKKCVPGMVVGGPAGSLPDFCAKSHLAGQPPAKCYIDLVQSYSTNEIDIYWNASFVFLLSAIKTLHQ